MARSATIAFAMSQLRRAEAYKGLDAPLAELWQHSAHVAAVSHVVAKQFTQVNADTALLAGLLQGVGKLYLLTRAARFPGLLQDTGTYQRVVAEWHGRVAQAILRNWEIAEEIVTAAIASENIEREHEGTTDLTDVLAVGGALAALGPDPQRRTDVVPRHAGRAPHEARRASPAAPRWRNRITKSPHFDRHWAHESALKPHRRSKRARCRTPWCSAS